MTQKWNEGKGDVRGTWALAAVFALGLMVPALAFGAEAKSIPVPQIPRKQIPGEVHRRQAQAFTKRQKKNRQLVQKARGESTGLKRGGTAYEN
ncbi:MAG: hypothetical protein O2807_07465 [bacterium]|nr:hypothetical protein [bacterium]